MRICVSIVCDDEQPSIGDETMEGAPMGQPGRCEVGHASPAFAQTSGHR